MTHSCAFVCDKSINLIGLLLKVYVEELWSTMKRKLLGAIENHTSVNWKRKHKSLPYFT